MLKQDNKGFTLVELTIVLVILALLAGGIMLSSEAMLGRANVSALISKINDLSAASRTFKSRFGYFPGDLPNAQSVVSPAISPGCNYAVAGTVGNGLVDSATESACALEHLVQAQLLSKVEFNSATNSYFIAAKKELVPHVITNSQLKLLENSNLSIEKVINKTFVFIDSLLLNIRGPESNEKESKYSALKIIKEALDSYPFLESERNTINVCSAIQDDFEIKGNKEVVVHIFHNLINNALYFVSKNKVPEIIISLKGNGSIRNQIVVEDNGVGIAKEDLEKIFDRFFTKGKNGTGLGLSFCKIGMQSMGGEIECFSKKHQYTKFILNFPQLIRGNNE